MRLISLHPSEILSRFNVGGKIFSLIDNIEKIASIAPDAPS